MAVKVNNPKKTIKKLCKLIGDRVQEANLTDKAHVKYGKRLARVLSNVTDEGCIGDPVGCCTYQVNGDILKENMTEADCNGLDGVWDAAPC